MLQERDSQRQQSAFEIAALDENAPSSNTSGSIPLVLIADDDDDNLLLISYALEMIGVGFIAARTGYEAMMISLQYRFSVILLDIRLPDVDGISILKWLRQKPRTQEVPVIAVTALAQRQDRDRILEAGFNDYLIKPYMLEDFNGMVNKYLC